MIRHERQFSSFKWVDLIEPKREDLKSLKNEFKLIDRIILNSMDPEHLPKYEKLGNDLVLSLRVIDKKKRFRLLNIQELTTKITIIIKGDVLLTIHRLDQDFLQSMRSDETISDLSRNDFLKKIVSSSIRTFDGSIAELGERSEGFEDQVFKDFNNKLIFKEGYVLKRTASAYKKIMKFYSEMFSYMSNEPEYQWRDYHAEKEYTDRQLFYVDDIQENINGLLALHLSVVSNRTNEESLKTNEVMRILTVLSLFFLPLNFLAGVYGMNFHNMPELNHPYGYFIILVIMFLISIGIFLWLHKKGWIHRADL